MIGDDCAWARPRHGAVLVAVVLFACGVSALPSVAAAAGPDPDPAPLPKPDPKPAGTPPPVQPPPPPVAPPVSPPAPPAPEPEPVVPEPPAAAPVPPAPGAVPPPAPPQRSRADQASRRVSVPAVKRARLPRSVVYPTRGEAVAAQTFPGLDEPGGALNVVALFVALLLGVAALLFASAGVSGSIVPWPRVALELDRHRIDLAVMGFVALAIAFALVFVQGGGL